MPQDYPVSVIVCTYNRAEQLSRIIGLLRNQNYAKDKYEIIIIDNGSTDNTKIDIDAGLKLSALWIDQVGIRN